MGAINRFAVGMGTFIKAPNYVDNRLIVTAGAAETVTVPTNGEYLILSASGDFYARWDGSAASVPTGDVADGTGSELNPVARIVTSGGTFSLAAVSASCFISLSFFQGADEEQIGETKFRKTRTPT